MSRLSGKVAVITGGAKGIGKGIAKVLMREGAAIAILDVDSDAGVKTVNELKQTGGKAVYAYADVTNFETLKKAAEEVQKELGGVNILCCNAGIFPSAILEEMTEADWDKVHNINLKGMFLTIKAFLPLLKAQPNGRIILTSSITGPITGYKGWSHYGATKAGMLGFMRSAAIELAPYGITINAVLPGNILTEGVQALGEEYIKTMSAAIPLKRLGTPEDIGYAVLVFASEEAGYITGQTLVVDGGQILPESHSAMD
ncbi:3-oxoacyl-ACP reductase FabG [Thermodesulfovibrio hydrogeniphilus]